MKEPIKNAPDAKPIVKTGNFYTALFIYRYNGHWFFELAEDPRTLYITSLFSICEVPDETDVFDEEDFYEEVAEFDQSAMDRCWKRIAAHMDKTPNR